MVALAYCLACKYGDHERHTEVIQAAPEGMLGGVRCKCQGECMNARAVPNPAARPFLPDWLAKEITKPDVQSCADHGTDCGCYDYRRLMAENQRLRDLYENAVGNRARFGWTINHLLEADEALRTVEEANAQLRAEYEASVDRSIELQQEAEADIKRLHELLQDTLANLDAGYSDTPALARRIRSALNEGER